MWQDQMLLGSQAAAGSPVVLYMLLTAGLVGVATQSQFTVCDVLRIVVRLINGMLLGIVVSLFAPDYLVMVVVGLAMFVALLVSIHLPLRTTWGHAAMARVPALMAGLIVGLLFLGHDVATTPAALLVGVMGTILCTILLCWGIFVLIGRLLPQAAFVIAQRVLGAWMVAIGVMTLTFLVTQW